MIRHRAICEECGFNRGGYRHRASADRALTRHQCERTILKQLGIYTHREIAARLGISPDALDQALVRARRRGLLAQERAPC